MISSKHDKCHAFSARGGRVHTHPCYRIEKRSFPWKRDLMARKLNALCESSSLYDDLALYLLLKEREKLQGKEIIGVSLLSPLGDGSACKEENCFCVPRVLVDALTVS